MTDTDIGRLVWLTFQYIYVQYGNLICMNVIVI